MIYRHIDAVLLMDKYMEGFKGVYVDPDGGCAQSWFGLEDQALEALYGSDYDLDSTHLSVEFISIPAWRMKDGKLIAIRDMETSHIKNCIKMIYRSNGTWRHQYLRYFEAELRKRKYLKNQPI